MKTKEAINILNHAVEYYDMNYDTGNKRDTTWEISKVWKALNHVASELDRMENESECERMEAENQRERKHESERTG